MGVRILHEGIECSSVGNRLFFYFVFADFRFLDLVSIQTKCESLKTKSIYLFIEKKHRQILDSTDSIKISQAEQWMNWLAAWIDWLAELTNWFTIGFMLDIRMDSSVLLSFILINMRINIGDNKPSH